MLKNLKMLPSIPMKANRILNVILVAMILIVLRVWHLGVVQYERRLEESRKPQRKVVIEPAARATIRDRFNLPLAVNRVQYQAAVLYSQIREVPNIEWKTDENGKRTKHFKRKEYISQLSNLLAEALNLDAERIEDLIYAKAAYYVQVPFVIKEEITEQEYYRLKMLEKDWPGIYVRRLPKRYYPRGRSAADIIGYMGAINKQEYEQILHEMKALEQFIADKEEGYDPDPLPGIESSSQARKRLKDLEEKAYTIHDYIGKTGIEGKFEKQLRGFYGKRSFYSDSKGRFIRELPGSRAPISGQRILLSLSSELQEYAEQLLAQNEVLRVVRLSHLGAVKKTILAAKSPWIKGGAIVALDPITGEIMAMASYPRFDPNDFIASGDPDVNREKRAHVNRWFENEGYIAAVWDQQQPLERERYDAKDQKFLDEKRWLNWDAYIDFVLPMDSALRKAIDRIRTVGQAVRLQQDVDKLMNFFEQPDCYAIFNLLYTGEAHEPYKPKAGIDKHALELSYQQHQSEIREIKRKLDPYFLELPQNYDKVLLVDLCRLAVDGDRFSPEILYQAETQTLLAYRDASANLVSLMRELKEMAKELYHDHDFKIWRQNEGKKFLDQKRLEEKQNKAYPKPYIDYLDQQEQKAFQNFWEQYRWDLLMVFLTGKMPQEEASVVEVLQPYIQDFERWYQELQQGAYQAVEWRKNYTLVQKSIKKLPLSLAKTYLQTMRSYQELSRPLLGRYRLRQRQNALEKHLAAAFYPVYGYGYGRSHAYRQSTIQGSLFKLVTAYAALVQNFKRLNRPSVTARELNPLVIVDQVYKQGSANYVGYTQDGKPIPQLYKGGRIPRSLAHQNNGEVDLIRALEVSSNPYFSLLAGDVLEDPEDLARAAQLFSYGSRTGIDLPGEISGQVPKDLTHNRTGLYAMAIGQHSLVVTPLQTAVMLATLANGGKVLKPKIVNMTAGRQPMRGEDQIPCLPSFPYQDSLSCVGIDFPFFPSVLREDQKSLVQVIPSETRRELFMPQIVRQMLLQGLRAVTNKTHQDSLASLARLYQQHPEAIRCFNELKHCLLGKTSTSESVENIDLDLHEGTNLYTHVWFGSIAFQDEQVDKNKTTFVFRDELGQPELVVVIYLRYGGYGKEAAPLAAQVVQKWREIKKKYAS